MPSIVDLAERISLLRDRITREGADDVRTNTLAVLSLNDRLRRLDPRYRTRDRRRSLGDLVRRAGQSQTNHAAGAAARVAAKRAVLRALDPRAVLARGYAALTEPTSDLPVWGVEHTSPGQDLRLHLIDGTVQTRVENVTPAVPERFGAPA